MKKVSTRVATALVMCGVSGNVLAQGMPWENQPETTPEVVETPATPAAASTTEIAEGTSTVTETAPEAKVDTALR